jgi:hypothetical protein
MNVQYQLMIRRRQSKVFTKAPVAPLAGNQVKVLSRLVTYDILKPSKVSLKSINHTLLPIITIAALTTSTGVAKTVETAAARKTRAEVNLTMLEMVVLGMSLERALQPQFILEKAGAMDPTEFQEVGD